MRRLISREHISTKPPARWRNELILEGTCRIHRRRPSDGEAPTPTVPDFVESPQRVSKTIRGAFLSSATCRQSLVPTSTSADTQNPSGLPRKFAQAIPCRCGRPKPRWVKTYSNCRCHRIWQGRRLHHRRSSHSKTGHTDIQWVLGEVEESPRKRSNVGTWRWPMAIRGAYPELQAREHDENAKSISGRGLSRRSILPLTEANSACMGMFSKSPPRTGVRLKIGMHLAQKAGCT